MSDSEKTDNISVSKAKERARAEGQWWRASEFERAPHEILDNVVKQIEDDHMSTIEAYKEYAKMYGSMYGNDSGDDAFSAILRGELTQNELANTIETLWAQVFKNTITAGVSTSEADFEEWYKARAYGRWLEGVLDEAEVHEEVFPIVGLDSLIFGTGIIKVTDVEDDEDPKLRHIQAHRVCPKYFFVDKIESRHGKPRNFYQKDHEDRWVLLEKYGSGEGLYGDEEDRRVGIIDAPANDDDELGLTSFSKCDMVTIREAWHLPSKPGAKDGRHVIWVKGCTLVDEPWHWDKPPFVFLRWTKPIEGFWGDSAVKRLAPTQNLLDKLNKKIDEAQDIMGVPRIIVRRGAKITKAHIDDVPGGVLETDDINGIKDWNAQCITPEIYQDRDNAPQKMRSLLGVSDFEVQSELPSAMREISGPALERMVDQGTSRHAMNHKAYEKAVKDLCLMFMQLAEDIQEDGDDVVVQAPGEMKSSVQQLKFKDVMISRKKLKLRILPMGQMPQSLSGKVKILQDMKEILPGMSEKTVARMTEVPDIAGTQDMLVSDEEIIWKNIYWMVKNKRVLPPLPYDNFGLIKVIVCEFINGYRVKDGADDEVVGMLSGYMDQVIAMEKGLGGPDPNAPPLPSDQMALQPGVAPAAGMPQAGPPQLGPTAIPPIGPMPAGPQAQPLPSPGAPPMM